ncbi:MAG: hypothetical protein AAF648_16160 [Pseudomonadota bacterium]
MTYCFSRGSFRRYAAFAYANPSSSSAQQRWQHYEHRRHGSGGGFGVRRPLRFLAHRLELDENQVRRLAVVLDRLKSEREQARLDDERAMSRAAELLIDGQLPERSAFEDSLAARRDSLQRLDEATTDALVHIAELLDPDQRREFAYLLSTRALAL